MKAGTEIEDDSAKDVGAGGAAVEAGVRQDAGAASLMGSKLAAEAAIARRDFAKAYVHIDELKKKLGEDDDDVMWLLAMCIAEQKGTSAALQLVRSHVVAGDHSGAVSRILKEQGRDLIDARRLALKQSEIIATLAHGIGRLQDINDSLGESMRVLRALDRSAELYAVSDLGFSAIPSSTRCFNVLYVSGDPASPSHAYRVQNYSDALATVGIQAETVRFGDLEALKDAVPRASIVVFWRCPLRADLMPMLTLCRLHRTPIVFDVDDYVFEPRIAVTKYIDGIRFLAPEVTEQYYWGIKAYRRLLLASDATTITTEYLAKRVGQFGRLAYVLPNGLDRHYTGLARGPSGRRETKGSETVVVGYAPGSKTHQRDFAECADALAEVLIENPNVRLLIIGLLDLDEFPLFSRVKSQIEVDTTLGREHLRERLSQVDIHIAPVELQNPFTESKSELKYFEPAAMGIPTIASATQPFRAAIQHGTTGYLATTQEEWKQALLQLTGDAQYRRNVGEAARADALMAFGLEAIGWKAKKAYEDIISRHRQGYGFAPGALTIRVILEGSGPIPHRDEPVIALVRGLADLGHHLQLVFLTAPRTPAVQLRADYDLPPSVAIAGGAEEFKPVDVLLATSAATAYWVDALKGRAAVACYLVQDYEPALHPAGPSALSASASYRLDMKQIALGEWVAGKLAEGHGTSPLTLAPFYDQRIFVPSKSGRPPGHGNRIVIASGNAALDRLVVQALKLLPSGSIEFDILGAWSGGSIPGRHRLHGIPSALSRAAIYQGAMIGVALSATTPSSFAFEMMACGLPLVDFDTTTAHSVAKYMDSGNVVLVRATPEGIANSIAGLLSDAERRMKIADLALDCVKQLPNEHQVADQLNQFLRMVYEGTA